MVTLLGLLNAHPDIQSSILAGFEGLNREIATITSIESPKSVEKLINGTLVMSAGVFFEGENIDKLYDYIGLLIKQGCIGLGLKTRFIQSVPQAALMLANMNGFIIFSLPDDFIWSDFFSTFYEMKHEGDINMRILNPTKNSMEALRHLSQYGPQFINELYVEMIRLSAVITDGHYQVLARNKEVKVDSIIDFLSCGIDRAGIGGDKHGFSSVDSFRSINYKNHRITDVILSGGAHLLMEHTGKNLSHDEIELLQFNYSNLLRSGQPYLSEEHIVKQLLHDLITNSPILNLNDLIAKQEMRRSTYVILYIVGVDTDEFIKRLRKALFQQKVFMDTQFFFYPLSEAGFQLSLCTMNTKLEDKAEWLSYFNSVLKQLDLPVYGIKLYFGEPVTFVGDIQLSYQQASRCMRYGDMLWNSESVLFFHDMDCLAALEQNDIDFSEIRQLDRTITSFDACETLEAILENKVLKHAANAIYIHENTMRYRIGKIQQILKMDIGASHIALNLLIKIKLYKLLGERKGTKDEDHAKKENTFGHTLE